MKKRQEQVLRIKELLDMKLKVNKDIAYCDSQLGSDTLSIDLAHSIYMLQTQLIELRNDIDKELNQ